MPCLAVILLQAKEDALKEYMEHSLDFQINIFAKDFRIVKEFL